MAKITILLVGVNQSPIVSSLLGLEDIEIDIICNNILDFELPPRVENAAPIWHRHELRNILQQIDPNKFQISSSLKNLLKENDMLDLDEEFLGVTSHISQIEQNSKDLFIAYNLLLEQTDRTNISLTPLVAGHDQINVVKNKKIAPLRYYHLTNELLDLKIPDSIDKKKASSKDLSIIGKNELQDLKLSDPAYNAMQESDLTIIIPTDRISLGVLVHAKELEKQIKNIQTPLVLLWNFDSDLEYNEYEEEIAEKFGFSMQIDSFAKDLSFLTDYVIIKKKEKDQLLVLRDHGCHVLVSEFVDEDDLVHPNLIQTILSVSDLEDHIPEGNHPDEHDNEIMEEELHDSEIEDEESEETDIPKSGKQISQLTESPEEAGIERIKEEEPMEEIQTEGEISTIINDITKRENEIDEEIRPVNSKKENESANDMTDVDQVDDIPAEPADENTEELQESEEVQFEVRDEEDWIDTVKRAIEQGFDENNEEALLWLIDQSGNDSDREMQIAEFAISAWIDSRSTPDRKRGAEIISMLAQNQRETYIQILQRHMLQAVKEIQEDKRRILIPLFSIIRDVDLSLSEQLIRGITKDLAIINEEDEISVIETAKLTLLQLVINSRRLSRICIQELLNILDSKPNIGPEIWNILIAFDAGSISLELVTNFSINKAEEIIRRSNVLRFTGSFYSTINKVVQAWKEGDKAAISSATGSILPEETLRKFERLELARKLDKLKMVQLSTLAESLGKDTETVERLITELIVNDELKAEMKLIDEKMYLVSVTDRNQNSGN